MTKRRISWVNVKAIQMLIFTIIICHLSSRINAQPEPCGVNAMTSTCLDACVVCDINGFTGRNDLTIQGQTFEGFCTTIFHNMSYIAFIAGTEDLTIEVTVTNCTINRGVEIGIFESFDCETFKAVTACNTDVAPNATATFSNTMALVVGQHYYLILDGSMGDICDWTFKVTKGSTVVGDLTTSGIIEGPTELCPEVPTTYSTTGELGATMFNWTVNGVAQSSLNQEIDITYPADGTYELCVTASNVCDEAPPSCRTITVVSPTPLFLEETICTDECIVVGGETLCESGAYEFLIPLPDGCDSLIFLDLTVLPEIASFIDINLCTGDEFFIGTSPFTSTGVFVETIQTDIGCDSIVTLDLTMIECEITGASEFTSPICNGDQNGTLHFSLENGSPPFNYNWSNITVPSLQGTGSSNLLTDIVIENVPAGFYEINVSDNFGNDVVFIQEVIDPPLLTIAIAKSDFNGNNLTCYQAADGFASVSGNGGVMPYSFLWSNNETGTIISDLQAGTYSVEITDAIGCITMEEIVLTEPDLMGFSATFINPNCDGLETGMIQLDSIWGGMPPYSFALDNNPYGPSSSYQNLGSGTYGFSVLDANSCLVDTSSTLSEADIPILYMDQDQTIDLGSGLVLSATTNNTTLVDISWSNLENSLECVNCLSTYAAPVNNTEYVLTVTSIDDCLTSDSILVTINKIRDVYVPNSFSPNGDGANDYFSLYPGKSVALITKLYVYDRWGSQLYAGADIVPTANSVGWDGYVNGKVVSAGVYVWMAEIEYLDGEIQVLSGDVTLFL